MMKARALRKANAAARANEGATPAAPSETA
jgi:hypothetical protein